MYVPRQISATPATNSGASRPAPYTIRDMPARRKWLAAGIGQ
ncbi:MAG: hypothetical protein OJF49_002200 [Ktedonobacterales bacterium]|nr:MAG: hypothetical protein OJF49_002200 [Ktedonobacterales bacterium]